MSKIGHIQQKTQNRFLNFYELEAIHRDGRVCTAFTARRKTKWF